MAKTKKKTNKKKTTKSSGTKSLKKTTTSSKKNNVVKKVSKKTTSTPKKKIEKKVPEATTSLKMEVKEIAKSDQQKKEEIKQILKNEEENSKTILPRKKDIILDDKIDLIELPKRKESPNKIVKTERFLPNDRKKKIEEQSEVSNAIIEEELEKTREEKTNSIRKRTKKGRKSKSKKIEKGKKSSLLKKFNSLKRRIKMYGLNSVIPVRTIVIVSVLIVLFVSAIITIPMLMKKTLSKIDLTTIPEKLDQLNTVAFDIDDTQDIITSSGAFSKLKDYYEYDFRDVFKLDSKFVAEYVIKYNDSKKEFFIVIKAKNGNQENVKKVFDSFFSEKGIKKYTYLEYQGYQLFIRSSNNDVVLSKIKQSQIRVFNILQELKKADIESVLGISEDDYEEALVKTAMLVKSDTCHYIIFKPSNDDSKNKIIESMNKYYQNLEEKWKDKNEENYSLVMKRRFEEYDGYLIYVVSHDNDLVMQLIKGNYQ